MLRFLPVLVAAAVPGTTHAQFLAPPANAITVSAEATVETAPDLAELTVSVRGEGKTPDEATRALASRLKAVSDGLRGLDPAAVVRTGSVAIGEVRAGECRRDSVLPLGAAASLELAADNLEQMADAATTGMMAAAPTAKDPCAVIGYIARSESSVLLRAVKDAGTAVGLAGRLGAASAGVERFDLVDDKAAHLRAVAAAVAKAKAQAEAIAAASSARLGPITAVTDGADRTVAAYAMQANMPAPAIALETPVAVDLTPQPVSTTARLTVIFALAR